MARIDWVKRRLENWAQWRAKMEGSGLGYSSTSVLLSIPGESAFETWLPVLEIEAEETHRAVESLKVGKGHLYMTLHLIYLKNAGVKRAALLMHRAESTIKAQLDQADLELRNWFDYQAELKKKKG